MASSNKKFSVLVVDDFPVVRKSYSDMCTSFSCEVQTAKNGKEAVDLFKAGNRFDLVLMEKDMPDMDGPTATKELREMGIDTRIVGMSFQDGEPEKSAFLAAGLNDFRAKPVNVGEVIAFAKAFKRSYKD